MSMKKSEVKVVRLDQMNPAPYNPRVDLRPSDPEYQKLENSMDAFGLVELIVWNEQTGNIVGGHQRYKILKAKGVEEIEVVAVRLPEDKEKVLNLALNNISGRNDEEKLRKILEEMDEASIELSGVDVDSIIAEMEDEAEEVQPEIEFAEELHEEHNYIVLYFKTDVDWINALTLFDLKQVKALDSKPSAVRIGIGRVLEGSKALMKLIDKVGGRHIEE